MSTAKTFSLLLLYENIAPSLPAIQGLKDKGIDVKVVDNAAALIKLLVSGSFDVVGLSVNHPSSSSLTKIIKTRLDVPLMVYGEDKKDQTMKKVQIANADFKINGLMTAYNAWMKIHALYKEKMTEDFSSPESKPNVMFGEGKQKESQGPILVKGPERKFQQQLDAEPLNITKLRSQGSDAGTSNEDQPLSTGSGLDIEKNEESNKPKPSAGFRRNSKKKKGGSRFIKKKSEETESQPEQSLNPEEADFSFTKNNDSAARMQDKENKGSGFPLSNKLFDIGIGSVDNKAQDAKASSNELDLGDLFDQEKQASSGSVNQDGVKKEEKEVGSVQMIHKDATNNQNYLDNSSDPESKGETFEDTEDLGLGAVESDPLAEENLQAPSMNDEKQSERATEMFAQEQAPEPVINDEEDNREKPTGKVIDFETAKKQISKPNENFIDKFKDAVKKAGSEKHTEKTAEEVEFGKVNMVTVVPVENNSEMGYLIFATQEVGVLEGEQINIFKEVLSQEKIINDDETVSLGETFNIEVYDTDMLAWAQSYSQFHCLMSSKESEQHVLVCFIKKEQIYPSLKKEEELNLYEIDLKEVPPMLPVNFKAFLYLKKNEKIIPYLKSGGSLSEKQINRLSSCGFESLFIKEEDIQNYFSFFVSKSVNQDLSPAEILEAELKAA